MQVVHCVHCTQTCDDCVTRKSQPCELACAKWAAYMQRLCYYTLCPQQVVDISMNYTWQYRWYIRGYCMLWCIGCAHYTYKHVTLSVTGFVTYMQGKSLLCMAFRPALAFSVSFS